MKILRKKLFHSYEFNKKEFQNLDIDLIIYIFNLNNWIDLNVKYKPLVFFHVHLNKSKNKYSIHTFSKSLNCYVHIHYTLIK